MTQKQLASQKPYTRKKIENFSYGLNDTIGKGYSSQVYRGRNDTNQEPVAVKVIDLKMLKCEINRTLLASEIEILKSMKNVPHILTLHEVYTTKNNTYIITQLCESDLSKRIKKGLSEQQVYVYMNQFLQGYSQIYEKKLIHRDLKPANLLLTHENQLKIADFGFGIKAQEVLRPSKYNVGSPLYMAPQSLKRNEYSFKTDIWAIGIIFFEMLTGDTPWRAKNQKQLLKKIQSEKIDSILIKKKFSPVANQFLSKALVFDKNSRLSAQQMSKYTFTKFETNILGQRHLNSALKLEKFQSINNQLSSPKNYIGKSVQKRLFQNTQDKTQKKFSQKNLNSTQNLSLKNIENLGKKTVSTPNPQIQKQDRKNISKLLISQVHFCRFLYKLLGRIKQSSSIGLLAEISAKDNVDGVFLTFTSIIKNKIQKLRNFESQNFLNVCKYDEYKVTSDFKKLIKISNDYCERYSSELKNYWDKSNNPVSFQSSVQKVYDMIEYLVSKLVAKVGVEEGELETIHIYSKDIIILDYLITCKQLLTMIIKDGQNYEKFARKSRIEEIVEGATSQINSSLYCKIIDRAKVMLQSGSQQ